MNNINNLKAKLNSGAILSRNESITLATAFFNALPDGYMDAALIEKVRKVLTSKRNLKILNVKVAVNAEREDKAEESFVINTTITNFAECPVSYGYMEDGVSRKVLISTVDGEQELVTVEGFSPNIANFEFDDKFAEKFIGHEALWYCPRTGYIYIEKKEDGAISGLKKTRRQRAEDAKKPTVYINMLRKTEIKNLPVDCIKFSLSNGLVTPSSVRTGRFYLTNDNGDYSSYIEYLKENVSSSFTSTSSVFKNISEMSKFFTRSGIAVTGQKFLVNIDTIAYVEKIGNFNESYEDCADGEFVLTASLVRKVMKLKSYEEALKELLQVRLTEEILAKIKVAQTTGMEAMLERHVQNGIRVVIISTNPNATFKDVQLLTDGNGAKKINLDNINTSSDDIVVIDKPIPMNLITVGKLTEGHFNKQILETYEVEGAKDNRLEEVKELLISQYDKELNRRLDDIRTRSQKNPSLSCNYSNDLIKALIPTSPYAMTQEENQQMSAVGEIVDKMALPLIDNAGRNCIFNMVAVVDRGLYYGKRILQEGEIFLGKFSRKLAELENTYGITSDEYIDYSEYCKKAQIFKSPKMKPDEFYSADVIDTNQIIKRINESDYFTTEEKISLVKDYTNMADCAIVFPGINWIIDLLADMDFDFDKNIVVLSNQFPALMVAHGKEKFDVIDTKTPRDKASSKDVKVKDTVLDARSKEFFYTNYIYTKAMQGSIGKITLDSETIIGVYTELFRGNDEPAKALFEELFGKEEGTGEYSVDNSVVNMNFVDDMIESMRNAKRTFDNMILFISDCPKVFRLYQGGTIDAAKTGIYLDIILTVNTIKILSLQKISMVNNTLVRKECRKTVKVKEETVVKGKTKEVWVEKPVILVNDFLGTVQTEMLEKANGYFKTSIEVIKKNLSWSGKIISQLSNAYAQMEANYPEELKLIRVCSSIYLSVAKAYGEALSHIDTKDEKEAEAIRETLTEMYRNKVAVIGATANRIMSTVNGSDRTKGAVVMAASMWRTGTAKVAPGINPNSQNKFAVTCFPKEVFSFLLKYDTVTCEGKILKQPGSFVGKTFVNKYQPGDVVPVSMGMSEDGLCLSESYTGLVEIYDENSVVIDKSFDDFKIGVKKEDVDSRLIVVNKNLVDKRVDNFLTTVKEDSVFIKNEDGIWYSKDKKSNFIDVCEIDEVILCDAVDDENYVINRVYSCDVYFQGAKPCYVIELAVI